MHLDQIQRRFQKLAETGVVYRIAPGVSADEIDRAELRMGVRFPEQIRRFYCSYNGLEVTEPALKLYALAEMERNGPLLEFGLCDRCHKLAFDTRTVNERGQWFIVNADTGYRITWTMASFWSIQMWSWIVNRRPIWCEQQP